LTVFPWDTAENTYIPYLDYHSVWLYVPSSELGPPLPQASVPPLPALCLLCVQTDISQNILFTCSTLLCLRTISFHQRWSGWPRYVFSRFLYTGSTMLQQRIIFKGGFLWIFSFYVRHCFICHPSDSTVRMLGSNPGQLRLRHWQSVALTTMLDLIHNRLDLIHTRLDLIHTRLDLIHAIKNNAIANNYDILSMIWASLDTFIATAEKQRFQGRRCKRKPLLSRSWNFGCRTQKNPWYRAIFFKKGANGSYFVSRCQFLHFFYFKAFSALEIATPF
jgi:hypothetical protein